MWTVTTDLDAAWAGFHDGTPARRYGRPSRSTIAVLALVVSGCLAQRPPPAEFIDYLTSEGYSFTVAVPPEDVVPASEVVAGLRRDWGEGIFPPGSPIGQPVYGLLGCVDIHVCGPYREHLPQPGRPVGVWFVPVPGVPGSASGVAWSLVDAYTNTGIMADGP